MKAARFYRLFRYLPWTQKKQGKHEVLNQTNKLLSSILWNSGLPGEIVLSLAEALTAEYVKHFLVKEFVNIYYFYENLKKLWIDRLAILTIFDQALFICLINQFHFFIKPFDFYWASTSFYLSQFVPFTYP